MPYINTVDINGTTYYFENLTDGNYVVDLPELKENGTFLLQGDVEDKLNSYQSNKPLSANQGRVLNEQDKQIGSRIDSLTAIVDSKGAELDKKITNLSNAMNSKDTELDGKIADLSKSSSQQDAELDEKIATLRTDMGNNDTSTLTSAQAYADEKSSTVLSSAKEYANTGLDKKLDKSGGKVSGALEVVGALIADQKLQTKYGMTIYQRGDVSKEITAVCTGENAGKFIGKSEDDLARMAVATPVNNDDAATKKYVDEKVASGGGSGGVAWLDVNFWVADETPEYSKDLNGYVYGGASDVSIADIITAIQEGKKINAKLYTDSRKTELWSNLALFYYDSNDIVSNVSFLGTYDDYKVLTGLRYTQLYVTGVSTSTDTIFIGFASAIPVPNTDNSDDGKMLVIDGSKWALKSLPTATTTAPGMMSAADKAKLDTIEAHAKDVDVDDTLSLTSQAAIMNKTVTAALGDKADRTVASQEYNGLMSAADKRKLDGVETGANKTVVDATLDGTSENPVQNKAVKAALDGKASAADVADLQNSVGKLEDGVAEIVKNNLFEINITDGSDTAWAIENGIASRNVVSNKTFAEILAASKAGKQLQCVYGHAVYRNVVADNKSIFVFDGASGYTGDDTNPFGVGQCPMVRVEITADAVVARRVGGELPVPNSTGADNGKMLIVSAGKWALQDVAGATVDTDLSTTSENPVQNKVVAAALFKKLDKTGGTVTGDLRAISGMSTGGSFGFGAAPIVLSQAADDAAVIHAGTADVDDNPPPLARLKVAAPTEDDDAATKQYVDALAAENVQDFLNAPVLTSPVMIRKEGATTSSGVYLSTVAIGDQAEIKLEDVNENSPVAIANLRTPTGTGTDSYAATKGYVDSKVSDAMILTSPNGTKYKITVSDDGVLGTAIVD